MMQKIKTVAVAAAFATLAAAPQAALATDWQGAYAGLSFGKSVRGGSGTELGLTGGYNFGSGGVMVYGGEVELDYKLGSTRQTRAAVLGRVGMTLGERTLVFGKAGVGRIMGSGGSGYWVAGIGAQYAMTDNMSLRADVDWRRPTGGGGGSTETVAKMGLVISF